MKDYVAKRSRQAVSKTDILAINSEAKKDQAKGNAVINASTGVFLGEDKKLGGVDLINEAMKEHLCDYRGYPNVYGDSGYLADVFSYVFQDKADKVMTFSYPFIGATLGGTGAVSLAFHLFLETGENVLLPDIMWTNYLLVAKKADVNTMEYHMFDDNGNFNLASVKETIEKAKRKSKRVLFVLNDPCHNPTGYCLSEKEYEELFQILEEEGKNCSLSVLFDIAYLSFYAVPGEHCALVDMLSKGPHSFLPLLAFSCSKLFGLYGLRVGALIALPEDKEEKEEIARAFGAQARGTYSVPNGAVQSCIHEVLSDKTKKEELAREIEVNTKELAKRSRVLIEELEEKKIPHYPYRSGFFVTLKVKDAVSLASKLKKEHVYVVPMDEHSLRLAISGMTEEEIRTLMGILLHYLEKE